MPLAAAACTCMWAATRSAVAERLLSHRSSEGGDWGNAAREPAVTGSCCAPRTGGSVPTIVASNGEHDALRSDTRGAAGSELQGPTPSLLALRGFDAAA